MGYWGYWTEYFSTVFKGPFILTLEERRNIKRIIDLLNEADKIVFKQVPNLVEYEHRVTTALKLMQDGVKGLREAARSVYQLLFEALLEETNYLKAIDQLRESIEAIGYRNMNDFEKQRVKNIVAVMKSLDAQERGQYQDVMAIIDEATEGKEALRASITRALQKLNVQSVLQKPFARREAKVVRNQISLIKEYASKMNKLQRTQSKDPRALLRVLENAETAVKTGYHESITLKKRALVWMMKVLYDMFSLRDMGIKYVKENKLPHTEVVEKDIASLNKALADILKEFRVIAQGFRIEVGKIEEEQGKLMKTLKKAA